MKDKLLQIRVFEDDLQKLDTLAKGKTRARTILDMIQQEYNKMEHSEIIQEFESYPNEVKEVFFNYASGNGYDHKERSVMLFRFFKEYFQKVK